jgi:hypothetical protein
VDLPQCRFEGCHANLVVKGFRGAGQAFRLHAEARRFGRAIA